MYSKKKITYSNSNQNFNTTPLFHVKSNSQDSLNLSKDTYSNQNTTPLMHKYHINNDRYINNKFSYNYNHEDDDTNEPLIFDYEPKHDVFRK